MGMIGIELERVSSFMSTYIDNNEDVVDETY